MIEIIKKVFTIFVNTEHLRFLLGLFFITVAMTGAIRLLSMVDIHYYLGIYENRPVNLSPIYYSACLFAGCWLLFGNEENNNTDK